MERRLPTAVAQVVERYRVLARERFGARIEEMRVFGSAARGEMHEVSDVDVFVLVDSRDQEIKAGLSDLAVDTTEALQVDFFINPFIVDRAHWAELHRLERLIVTEIERDGLVL